MADKSVDVHVRVLTLDPAENTFLPVPGAQLLIEHDAVINQTLFEGEAVTDIEGRLVATITYDEAQEGKLNPFVTITLPDGSRAVPAAAPAPRQVQLPEEWETLHSGGEHLKDIHLHNSESFELELFVGLPARFRLEAVDFHPLDLGNPGPLPQDTLRIHLADYDVFIFDCLNPDDPLTGKGYDPNNGAMIDVGGDGHYPYFDVPPRAPDILDLPPEERSRLRAWVDPPGSPVGRVGGGGMARVGPLAVDRHGFVFVIDQNVIRRFYPDGTLCETLSHSDLRAPTGIAVDQYRNLFVADPGENRVLLFYLGEQGRYQHEQTLKPFDLISLVPLPDARDTFDRPAHLAVVPNRVVDANETLVVGNEGNGRILLLTIDVHNSGSAARRTVTETRPRFSNLGGFGEAVASPPADDQISLPSGVAVDYAGRVYVSDRERHRVTVWEVNTSAGLLGASLVASWGAADDSPGDGNRRFDTPGALALDAASGHLYVAEAGNQRVLRVAADNGDRLDAFQSGDLGTDSPLDPVGLAMDGRGELYIADRGTRCVHRTSVYDADGSARASDAAPRLVKSWGSLVDDDRLLRNPAGLALGGEGRLWVCDEGRHRVVGYRWEPVTRTYLQATTLADGLHSPQGVTEDADGNLYVADTAHRRVRRYDSELNLVATFGDSWPASPSRLAVGADGRAYVVEGDTGRIQIFSADGERLRSFGEGGRGEGQFFEPGQVAVAPGGELYVADAKNARIQKLDADGNFLLQWGEPGDGDGQFKEPRGVAVAADGRVYVADTKNHRVQRFDANGAFELAWGSRGVAAGEFESPRGVAVAPDGRVYVTDTGNDRVQRFSAGGAHQLSFGSSGTAVGFFKRPESVAVASDGRVYVADPQNRRVQRFDANGTNPREFDGIGTLVGPMNDPVGVAVAPDGTVLVADTGSNLVARLSADLAFVERWGEGGRGDEELRWPVDVAVARHDGTSRLLVVDQFDDSVRVLDLDGNFLHKLEEAAETPFDRPRSAAADSGGRVFLADPGNHRLVSFDADLDPAGGRAFGVGDPHFELRTPTGLSVDDEGQLLVTDKVAKRVYRLSPEGNLLGYWDLLHLVRQRAAFGAAKDGVVKFSSSLTATPAGDPGSGLSVVTHDGSLRLEEQGSGNLLDSEYLTVGATLLVQDGFTVKKSQLLGYHSRRFPKQGGDLLMPELARQVTLGFPTSAVLNPQGVLVVSDPSHDSLRLLQTRTDLALNLFDLGRGVLKELPDLSFRIRAQGEWQEELNLRARAALYTPGRRRLSKTLVLPNADRDRLEAFSEDRYEKSFRFGRPHRFGEVANAMRVTRRVQRWMTHLTRTDGPEERWGAGPESERVLNLGLVGVPRQTFFRYRDNLVTLGVDRSGRGPDSWDDGVVAHELGHWIQRRFIELNFPYDLENEDGHFHDEIINQNVALIEGFAEFVGLFWGSEHGSHDPVRGYPLRGFGVLTEIARDTDNYTDSRPLFHRHNPDGTIDPYEEPGQGLQNEGYFANTLWQLHHATVSPGILFADAPDYWYGYNTFLSDEESELWVRLFAETLPLEPPESFQSRGSEFWLLKVLEKAHELAGADAGLAFLPQLVRSLCELNNQLMPQVRVVQGGGLSGTLGASVETTQVSPGSPQTFTVELQDATGAPLEGHSLRFLVPTAQADRFSHPAADPVPDSVRGVAASGVHLPGSGNDLFRATNESGRARIRFEAQAEDVGQDLELRVGYQPDFDTDPTFAPPGPGLSRTERLRQLYLYELRGASKTAGGIDNNLGAWVSQTVTLQVRS